MEKILLCGFSPDRGETVQRIAEGMGMDVRVVEPYETGLPIMALLTGAQTGKQRGGYPESVPETMVMAIADRARMDEFLAGLRSAGITVPYKAVLTPFNGTWTLASLQKELAKEHLKMTGRKEPAK